MLTIKMKLVMSSLLFSMTFALAHAGTWTTDSYKGMYGTRTYKVYVPKTLEKNIKAPVVVMLHGCQQDANEFAKGTRIEKWAWPDTGLFCTWLQEFTRT